MEPLIKKVYNLLKKEDLTYDQTRHLFKEVRQRLGLKAVKNKKGAVERLSRLELEAFINEAYKTTYGLAMDTLFQTAARVQEFVDLKIEDVYFEELKIVIQQGKGNKRREVPISQSLANMLRIHLDKHTKGHLFRSNRFKQFSVRRIQQITAEIGKEAGILKKVHPHILRHTRATMLAEDGLSKDLLQQFLGHENPNTTQVYTNTANLQLNKEFQKLY